MGADVDDDRPGDDERHLQARLDANLAAADVALQEALKTPTVKGSTGQARPNPLFATAAKHDELALSIHRQLEDVRQRRRRDAEDAEVRALTTDSRLR